MRQFPVMIFAAGFGTRMGALTQTMPKPLITVGGKTLLDHALDLTKGSWITRKVVNTHYLADQIALHLWGRDVAVSPELDTILETGGGLRRAMPLLGASPVMTLNSDAVWTGRNPLQELREAWDPDRMDALLLVAPIAATLGFTGTGDFSLGADNRLIRAVGQPGLAYLGAQILRTDLLPNIPQATFSLNLIWDQMIAAGRAYGLLHQGGWCDVGCPDGIVLAETMLGTPSGG